MAAETPTWTDTAGSLAVRAFASPAAMGRAAAQNTAAILREAVAEHGSARIIMATGNSQLPFVEALRDIGDVPWNSLTVFHMDEYVGLPADHPASFRRWIDERIATPLKPAAVHYIEGDRDDAEAEAARYEALLREAPLDLVCMGIGENGHIAFNEPFAADFSDSRWARIITLDEKSRAQQVGEGHFPDIASVPEHAISLTVPALLAPRNIQVVVPEQRKAAAVRASLHDEISNACPATVLRTQERAVLFLDADAASLLTPRAS